MEKHKIFAFVGPTRAGKTTLIRRLVAAFPDDLKIAPSLCTRTSRGPEDDDTYRFTTREKILDKQAAGKLIQISEYAGELYANDRDDMNRLLKHQHAAMALTEHGVLNFKAAGYDVVVIRIRSAGQQQTADTNRAQADVARAAINIPAHIEILNSFSPGGLETATEELTRLVKRIISPPNSET